MTEPQHERPYVKVTGEMELAVVAYKTLHPLDSYGDIGDALDMPPRTVQYILSDLPRARRMHNPEKADASLKQRILGALDILAFNNVAELQRVLGRADDKHNIVHVLWALKKEGKVDFDEDKNRDHPIRIHMTARGKGLGLKNGDTPVLAKADGITPPTAQPEETPVMDTPEEEALEPIPAFPLLDELLEREKERLDHDGKAMAYITAAEAVQDVDPEMARQLTEKADAFNATYPSPLEAEYLRYAASHATSR